MKIKQTKKQKMKIVMKMINLIKNIEKIEQFLGRKKRLYMMKI